jgi:ferredoxin
LYDCTTDGVTPCYLKEDATMAMKITDECTACGLCTPECPNEAIAEGDIFVIDPDKCDECEGVEGGSRCVEVCPVDCIEKA